MIGAAFFFAALIFVATAEPGIDASVADVRTISVDADAVDVTIVKFYKKIKKIMSFEN